MDFYKVPLGFGMALSMNPNALNAYSALSEELRSKNRRFWTERTEPTVSRKCIGS